MSMAGIRSWGCEDGRGQFIGGARLCRAWRRDDLRLDGVSTHRELEPARNLMIGRVWHGWTSAENADAYERLLREEIATGIGKRLPAGYRGMQIMRRDIGGEVEFLTLMQFDSIETIRAFAGDDYEVAVVPPKARALLARFDARSQHYAICSLG